MHSETQNCMVAVFGIIIYIYILTTVEYTICKLGDLRYRHRYISTTKIIPNTATIQFCVSERMMVFCSWMNQSFKWFGSITITHLLTVTWWHLLAVLISHVKYLFFFYFMMYLIRVISTLCRAVALRELSLTPLVYPIFMSLSLLKCN